MTSPYQHPPPILLSYSRPISRVAVIIVVEVQRVIFLTNGARTSGYEYAKKK
jgi:hypothetical protein